MSLLHFSPPAHTNGSNLLVHHVTLRCALAGMHCTNDSYTRRYTCISPLLTVARWTRCSFLCGGPFSCHDYTSTPVQERSTHEETRKATAPTAYKHWLARCGAWLYVSVFSRFGWGWRLAMPMPMLFPSGLRRVLRSRLVGWFGMASSVSVFRLCQKFPSDPFACSFAALFPV